jgi:hypothetical protein
MRGDMGMYVHVLSGIPLFTVNSFGSASVNRFGEISKNYFMKGLFTLNMTFVWYDAN